MQLGKNQLIVLSALILLAGGWIAWRHQRAAAELAARRPTSVQWVKPQTQIVLSGPVNRVVPRPAAAAQNAKAATAEESGAGDAAGTMADTAAATAGNAAPQPASAPSQALLNGYYNGLFRRLNFTPEQVAQFKALREAVTLEAVTALPPAERDQMSNNGAAFNRLVATTEVQLDAQILAQFGETVFTQYKLDQQTFAQRITVDQLEQSLSSSPAPLTEDQTNQLVQILARTENAEQQGMITPESIAMAAGVLSEPQLQALQQLAQQQATGGN